MNNVKKCIAGFLALIVLPTQIVFAYKPEANFWTERRCALMSSQTKTFVPSNNLNNAGTGPFGTGNDKPSSPLESIPFAYGSIRKSIRPQHSSRPTVLHIQDVHQNPEAQANISKTIQALIEDGRVSVIGLEGSDQVFDLSVFKNYSNQPAVRASADYFLKENQISGAIHGALHAQGKLPVIIGVEDKIEYDRNVQAYLESAKLQQKVRGELEIRAAGLKKQLKDLNPQLQTFDSTVNDYNHGTISLGDFLQVLTGAAGAGLRSEPDYVSQSDSRTSLSQIQRFLFALNMESKLDHARIEIERQHLLKRLLDKVGSEKANVLMQAGANYRAGRIRSADFYAFLKDFCTQSRVSLNQYPHFDAYVQYVLLSDEIDATVLFNESRELELKKYESLCTSDHERRWVASTRQLRLSRKLVDFALTPEEWGEYREGRHSGLDPESSLTPFERFYSQAEKRDKVMAKKLLDSSFRWNDGLIVLVTGGFHSQGLDKYLTDAGYDVVSFVPKITKVDATNGSAYLSSFAQEKTPLQKIFEGEKLFLAQPSLPPHIEHVGLPLGVEVVEEGLDPKVNDPETLGARDIQFRLKDGRDGVEGDIESLLKIIPVKAVVRKGEIEKLDVNEDPKPNSLGFYWASWRGLSGNRRYVWGWVSMAVEAGLLVFNGLYSLDGSFAGTAAFVLIPVVLALPHAVFELILLAHATGEKLTFKYTRSRANFIFKKSLFHFIVYVPYLMIPLGLSPHLAVAWHAAFDYYQMHKGNYYRTHFSAELGDDYHVQVHRFDLWYLLTYEALASHPFFLGYFLVSLGMLYFSEVHAVWLMICGVVFDFLWFVLFRGSNDLMTTLSVEVKKKIGFIQSATEATQEEVDDGIREVYWKLKMTGWVVFYLFSVLFYATLSDTALYPRVILAFLAGMIVMHVFIIRLLPYLAHGFHAGSYVYFLGPTAFSQRLLQMSARETKLKRLWTIGQQARKGKFNAGMKLKCEIYMYADPDVIVRQAAALTLFDIESRQGTLTPERESVLKSRNIPVFNMFSRNPAVMDRSHLPEILSRLRPQFGEVNNDAQYGLFEVPEAEIVIPDLIGMYAHSKDDRARHALAKLIASLEGEDGRYFNPFRHEGFSDLDSWIYHSRTTSEVIEHLQRLVREGASSWQVGRLLFAEYMKSKDYTRRHWWFVARTLGISIDTQMKVQTTLDAGSELTIAIFDGGSFIYSDLIKAADQYPGVNFIWVDDYLIQGPKDSRPAAVLVKSGYKFVGGTMIYVSYPTPLITHYYMDQSKKTKDPPPGVPAIQHPELHSYIDQKDVVTTILREAGLNVPVTRIFARRQELSELNGEEEKIWDLRERNPNIQWLDSNVDVTAEIRNFLVDNKLEGGVVKPNDSSGGEGIRLYDQTTLDLAEWAAMNILRNEDVLLLQERIVPPPLTSADGVKLDYNIGAYITWDEKGRGIVNKNKLVRYGPAGQPINISAGASLMDLKALCRHLGWEEERYEELDRKIDEATIQAFSALFIAMRKNGVDSRAPYCDFGRSDLMIRVNASTGEIEVVILELSGPNAGGIELLDEYMRRSTGDPTTSSGIIPQIIDSLIRRAQSYRTEFEEAMAKMPLTRDELGPFRSLIVDSYRQRRGRPSFDGLKNTVVNLLAGRNFKAALQELSLQSGDPTADDMDRIIDRYTLGADEIVALTVLFQPGQGQGPPSSTNNQINVIGSRFSIEQFGKVVFLIILVSVLLLWRPVNVFELVLMGCCLGMFVQFAGQYDESELSLAGIGEAVSILEPLIRIAEVFRKEDDLNPSWPNLAAWQKRLFTRESFRSDIERAIKMPDGWIVLPFLYNKLWMYLLYKNWGLPLQSNFSLGREHSKPVFEDDPRMGIKGLLSGENWVQFGTHTRGFASDALKLSVLFTTQAMMQKTVWLDPVNRRYRGFWVDFDPADPFMVPRLIALLKAGIPTMVNLHTRGNPLIASMRQGVFQGPLTPAGILCDILFKEDSSVDLSGMRVHQEWDGPLGVPSDFLQTNGLSQADVAKVALRAPVGSEPWSVTRLPGGFVAHQEPNEKGIFPIPIDLRAIQFETAQGGQSAALDLSAISDPIFTAVAQTRTALRLEGNALLNREQMTFALVVFGLRSVFKMVAFNDPDQSLQELAERVFKNSAPLLAEQFPQYGDGDFSSDEISAALNDPDFMESLIYAVLARVDLQSYYMLIPAGPLNPDDLQTYENSRDIHFIVSDYAFMGANGMVAYAHREASRSNGHIVIGVDPKWILEDGRVRKGYIVDPKNHQNSYVASFDPPLEPASVEFLAVVKPVFQELSRRYRDNGVPIYNRIVDGEPATAAVVALDRHASLKKISNPLSVPTMIQISLNDLEGAAQQVIGFMDRVRNQNPKRFPFYRLLPNSSTSGNPGHFYTSLHYLEGQLLKDLAELKESGEKEAVFWLEDFGNLRWGDQLMNRVDFQINVGVKIDSESGKLIYEAESGLVYWGDNGNPVPNDGTIHFDELGKLGLHWSDNPGYHDGSPWPEFHFTVEHEKELQRTAVGALKALNAGWPASQKLRRASVRLEMTVGEGQAPVYTVTEITPRFHLINDAGPLTNNQKEIEDLNERDVNREFDQDRPSEVLISRMARGSQELEGVLRELGGAFSYQVQGSPDHGVVGIINVVQPVVELHARLGGFDQQQYFRKGKFHEMVELFRWAPAAAAEAEAIELGLLDLMRRNLAEDQTDSEMLMRIWETFALQFGEGERLSDLSKEKLMRGDVPREWIWHLIACVLSDDYSGPGFPNNLDDYKLGTLRPLVRQTLLQADDEWESLLKVLLSSAAEKSLTEILVNQVQADRILENMLVSRGLKPMDADFLPANIDLIQDNVNKARQLAAREDDNLNQRIRAQARQSRATDRKSFFEPRRMDIYEPDPETRVFDYVHPHGNHPVKHVVWDFDGTIAVFPQGIETLALIQIYSNRERGLSLDVELDDFEESLLQILQEVLKNRGRESISLKEAFHNPNFREKGVEAKIQWLLRQREPSKETVSEITEAVWEEINKKWGLEFATALKKIEYELLTPQLRDANTFARIQRVRELSSLDGIPFSDRSHAADYLWLRAKVSNEMDRRRGQWSPLIEGVLDRMKDFQERGIMQSIVTKGSKERITISLAEYGLLSYFEDDHAPGGYRVWGRGIDSNQDIDKAALLGQVRERYQHYPEDLIYIGNWPEDVAAADSAGIRSVVIAADDSDFLLLLEDNPNYRYGPFMIIRENLRLMGEDLSIFYGKLGLPMKVSKKEATLDDYFAQLSQADKDLLTERLRWLMSLPGVTFTLGSANFLRKVMEWSQRSEQPGALAVWPSVGVKNLGVIGVLEGGLFNILALLMLELFLPNGPPVHLVQLVVALILSVIFTAALIFSVHVSFGLLNHRGNVEFEPVWKDSFNLIEILFNSFEIKRLRLSWLASKTAFTGLIPLVIVLPWIYFDLSLAWLSYSFAVLGGAAVHAHKNLLLSTQGPIARDMGELKGRLLIARALGDQNSIEPNRLRTQHKVTFYRVKNADKAKELAEVRRSHIAKFGPVLATEEDGIVIPFIGNIYDVVRVSNDGLFPQVDIKKLSDKEVEERLGLERIKGRWGWPIRMKWLSLKEVIGRLSIWPGKFGWWEIKAYDESPESIRSFNDLFRTVFLDDELTFSPARLEVKGAGTSALSSVHTVIDPKTGAALVVKETRQSVPNSNIVFRLLDEDGEKVLSRDISKFLALPGALTGASFQPHFHSPPGFEDADQSAGDFTLQPEIELAGISKPGVSIHRSLLQDTSRPDVQGLGITHRMSRPGSLRIAEVMREWQEDRENSFLGRQSPKQRYRLIQNFLKGLGENIRRLASRRLFMFADGGIDMDVQQDQLTYARTITIRLAEGGNDLRDHEEATRMFRNNFSLVQEAGGVADLGEYVRGSGTMDFTIKHFLSLSGHLLEDMRHMGILVCDSTLGLLNAFLWGFIDRDPSASLEFPTPEDFQMESMPMAEWIRKTQEEAGGGNYSTDYDSEDLFQRMQGETKYLLHVVDAPGKNAGLERLIKSVVDSAEWNARHAVDLRSYSHSISAGNILEGKKWDDLVSLKPLTRIRRAFLDTYHQFNVWRNQHTGAAPQQEFEALSFLLKDNWRRYELPQEGSGVALRDNFLAIQEAFLNHEDIPADVLRKFRDSLRDFFGHDRNIGFQDLAGDVPNSPTNTPGTRIISLWNHYFPGEEMPRNLVDGMMSSYRDDDIVVRHSEILFQLVQKQNSQSSWKMPARGWPSRDVVIWDIGNNRVYDVPLIYELGQKFRVPGEGTVSLVAVMPRSVYQKRFACRPGCPLLPLPQENVDKRAVVLTSVFNELKKITNNVMSDRRYDGSMMFDSNWTGLHESYLNADGINVVRQGPDGLEQKVAEAMDMFVVDRLKAWLRENPEMARDELWRRALSPEFVNDFVKAIMDVRQRHAPDYQPLVPYTILWAGIAHVQHQDASGIWLRFPMALFNKNLWNDGPASWQRFLNAGEFSVDVIGLSFSLKDRAVRKYNISSELKMVGQNSETGDYIMEAYIPASQYEHCNSLTLAFKVSSRSDVRTNSFWLVEYRRHLTIFPNPVLHTWGTPGALKLWNWFGIKNLGDIGFIEGALFNWITLVVATFLLPQGPPETLLGILLPYFTLYLAVLLLVFILHVIFGVASVINAPEQKLSWSERIVQAARATKTANVGFIGLVFIIPALINGDLWFLTALGVVVGGLAHRASNLSIQNAWIRNKNKNMVVFFPPAGFHSPGFGKDIYDAYPYVRDLYHEINRHAREVLNKPEFDFMRLSFFGSMEEWDRVENINENQLAIVAYELGLWEIAKRRYGFDASPPYAISGLSRGSSAAGVASGALDLRQAVAMTIQSSALIKFASDQTHRRMALVTGLSDEVLRDIVRYHGAAVAIQYAREKAAIVSYPEENKYALVSAIKEARGKFVPVPIPAATHDPKLIDLSSPVVSSAFDRFTDFMSSELKISDPFVPMLSCFPFIDLLTTAFDVLLEEVVTIGRGIDVRKIMNSPWMEGRTPLLLGTDKVVLLLGRGDPFEPLKKPSEEVAARNKNIAVVFAPSGFQFKRMGKDLYEKHPIAKTIYDAINMYAREILQDPAYDFTQLSFGDEPERFGDGDKVIAAQLSVLAFELAEWELAKQSYQFDRAPPAFLVGLSRGMSVAGVVSGSLTLRQAVEHTIRNTEFFKRASDVTGRRMAVIQRNGNQLDLDERIGTIQEKYGAQIALRYAACDIVSYPVKFMTEVFAVIDPNPDADPKKRIITPVRLGGSSHDRKLVDPNIPELSNAARRYSEYLFEGLKPLKPKIPFLSMFPPLDFIRTTFDFIMEEVLTIQRPLDLKELEERYEMQGKNVLVIGTKYGRMLFSGKQTLLPLTLEEENKSSDKLKRVTGFSVRWLFLLVLIAVMTLSNPDSLQATDFSASVLFFILPNKWWEYFGFYGRQAPEVTDNFFPPIETEHPSVNTLDPRMNVVVCVKDPADVRRAVNILNQDPSPSKTLLIPNKEMAAGFRLPSNIQVRVYGSELIQEGNVMLRELPYQLPRSMRMDNTLLVLFDRNYSTDGVGDRNPVHDLKLSIRDGSFLDGLIMSLPTRLLMDRLTSFWTAQRHA